VGTPSSLDHWKLHESKLFKEMIPKASGGKLTANAKPRDELGLAGFPVMRQLRLGAFDFVFGDFTYVAGDSPIIEGTELSGLAQSVDQYRQMQEAYKPVFDKIFKEKFGAKILLMYAWPSQQLWCNFGDRNRKDISLKDLAGKKVRTFSAPQGDFVTGLKASPVSITFAEVVPALQKGVADCALTGTLPAYSAKWYQVVTHNIRIRLGYIGSFLAVRNKVWNGLSKEAQDVITGQIDAIREDMWTWTKNADQLGMDCNAQGPCPIGPVGNMTAIEPSDADKALVKDIVANRVVRNWVQRCGDQCAGDWNATVGKVLGISASK
ncbi:MAG: TRAP transporter substrate-binding protein, partial [Acetobacteraceae bacterium]